MTKKTKKTKQAVKRYLVFGGAYSRGGAYDFKGGRGTKKAAIKLAALLLASDQCECAHVLDTVTGIIYDI